VPRNKQGSAHPLDNKWQITSYLLLWVIYIEKINGPFLFGDKGTPAEYSAGLELAIARGWLELHESGTYVKFTQAGAELFA
jgi:hypothetical protein